MPDLSFPLLSAAIALPCLAALATLGHDSRARAAGLTGAAASALCSVEIFREVTLAGGARLAEPWALGLFAADKLNAIFLALYSLLAFATLALAPRRDTDAKNTAATLVLLATTLATYSAEHIPLLFLGWTASALPFILGPFVSPGAWRPRFGLAASCVALGAALAMIVHSAKANGAQNPFALATMLGHNYGGPVAFALLIAAIVFRKGIFPAHAWIADAAEAGPVLRVCLLINGHLGAFLLARVVIPDFPLSSHGTFPLLSDLALFTALYVALRAVGESRPRRLLSLLVISQSACILAGLESGTHEGATGALIHCIVVAVATTGLFGVLRLLEVRFGDFVHSSQLLGLAAHTPRLAVFFAVCGLALVGLPGTLGFCSEDLLIHGNLESHPQIGLLLPVATAMNAVSLYRLFSRLFLGRQPLPIFGVADALPRERWVLSSIVLLIVLSGLVPNAVVAIRANAALDVVPPITETSPPTGAH